MSMLIIAEAGVNHNGDMGMAKEMISAAAMAGADVVKFQTFKADKLALSSAPKAQYQQDLTGSDENQHTMLKKLELSLESHEILVECCNKNNIEFLSTAFEKDSLDFLVSKCLMKRLKIPSGEITNGPFLLEHAKTNKNIILSTGMASEEEVRDALAVLSWGYLKPDQNIDNLSDCQNHYMTPEAREIIQRKVTLLHCTSQYPAPPESVNLNAISSLKQAFNIPVGYSDHTLGNTAAVGATILGASVIEKHFTLNKELEGPDHKASASPEELTGLIKEIRLAMKMLGDGVKQIQSCEAQVSKVIRKSIIASKHIKKGEIITSESLDILRPDQGTSPMKYWNILNTKAKKSYLPGDVIQP